MRLKKSKHKKRKRREKKTAIKNKITVKNKTLFLILSLFLTRIFLANDQTVVLDCDLPCGWRGVLALQVRCRGDSGKIDKIFQSLFKFLNANCVHVDALVYIHFLRLVIIADASYDMQMIPNVEFWQACAGLIRDGSVFLYAKVTCQHTRGGYQPV